MTKALPYKPPSLNISFPPVRGEGTMQTNDFTNESLLTEKNIGGNQREKERGWWRREGGGEGARVWW